MKTRLIGAIVVILGGVMVTEPMLACGEKFLMRSRGTRFQRAAPARTPASILVYATALNSVPVDATLRKAGYRPTTVTSLDEFKTASGRGGWDLVICDLADCSAYTQPSQGLNAPRVLPVVLNKADAAGAKKQHQHILKAPAKSQQVLDTVDDALAAKPVAPANPGR